VKTVPTSLTPKSPYRTHPRTEAAPDPSPIKSLSRTAHPQTSTRMITKENTSPPIELCLPHAVSAWKDCGQNERSHVLVAMPSGMRPVDRVEPKLIKEGSVLEVGLKCQSDMFSAKQLMSHTQFANHYDESNPTFIAIQESMDAMMGKCKHCKSFINIKLPGPGYKFTDQAVSGHSNLIIINDPFYDVDENGKKAEIPAKSTLFCLFDFVVKNINSNQQLSKRPVLEDNFDSDS